MSFNYEKDVWDKKITVHIPLKEKYNEVLTRIALDEGKKKTTLIEEILENSILFQNHLKRLEDSGHFGDLEKKSKV